MMQTYLINTMFFCGVLLLIALTVAVILLIMTLVDVRRMTKEVKKKFDTLSSMVDIATLLLGGAGGAGKRIKNTLVSDKSTIVAFVAGLKKGLQVLLKK